MLKFIRNLTLAAIVSLIPYAQATVYSWVDETGNTHFSDTPIEGSEEVDVQVHSTGSSLVNNQNNKNQSQAQSGQNTGKKGPPSNNQGGEQGDQELPLMEDGNMPPPPPSGE